MATYAFLSASRVFLECGESTRMGLPPESRTRGKRLMSDLTQFGAQSMAPFFHVPNQSMTTRKPSERARRRIWSKSPEIELAFLALDFVPVDRILDGVRAHGLELGPGGLHAVREGAVVVDLAAQNDERFPVHHERELVALLDQLRNGLGLPEGKGNGGCQDQTQPDGLARQRDGFSCHSLDSPVTA